MTTSTSSAGDGERADPALEQAPARFPCAGCGASLEFTPGTDSLVCPRCARRYVVEQRRGGIGERDYFAGLAQAGDEAPTEVRIATRCEACGARFELAPNVHAGACPYCDSPIVLDPREERRLPVHALLPFRIGADDAREGYRRWIAGLWFAPTRLTRFAREERDLTGVYLPHWTFDCHATCRYAGERGDVYQVPVRERVRIGGRTETRLRMETRVRWSPARGTVELGFDDVLVPASDAVPGPLVRSLAPWDLEQLVDYDPAYLSGFGSELYAVDLDDGFRDARRQIVDPLRAAVRRDIGGELQRIHRMDTLHDRIRYRLVLLPLWVAAFRFRDEVYRFVVNGRTGEVRGERPYSRWKIAVAVLLALAAFAAAAYLAGH